MRMMWTVAVVSLTWAALPAFLCCGAISARADELSDLRANQELLQARIDQLAQQVSPSSIPGAPTFTPAAGLPSIAGTFPRSFLMPGTDVSLRIGGQAVGSVLWYIKGAAVGGALNGTGAYNETFTDGQGGKGNLPNIPLARVPGAFSNGAPAVGPGSVVGFAHSRSSEWEFSGKQSNLFLDARVPSAWGEIAAFVSMDFSAPNANTILNNNEGSVNGYIPRLREGYVRWGGLLAGQTISTFVDNDSSPELLDFSGQTSVNFIVSRTPQVRYTYLLPMGMSVAVSAEQPDITAAGPFGAFFTDANQIPTEASCAALAGTAATATGAAIATNITNACLGNAAFFNPLQQLMPTFVQRWRIEQPWGHIQFGVGELLYTLNDGLFLNNRQYVGYGATVSGNTFPGWFGWSKDNITYGLAAGNGIGDQIANCNGLATNFGGAIGGNNAVNATNSTSTFTTNRPSYDAAVISRTIPCFGAHMGYVHWWNDNLRSNVDFSMNHQDVASQLIGASGAGSVNKELDLAHINLIWSPAAFLDLGIEGAWGHRQVVDNIRGDAYTVQTSMKFRF
jgi:hypothetical protein